MRLFKYMQRQQWCAPSEHIYTIMIGILGEGAREGTHGTARQSRVRHSTVRQSTTRHGRAEYGTAQHGRAQHGTAEQGTAQNSMAQHNTSKHGTARQRRVEQGGARHSAAKRSDPLPLSHLARAAGCPDLCSLSDRLLPEAPATPPPHRPLGVLRGRDAAGALQHCRWSKTCQGPCWRARRASDASKTLARPNMLPTCRLTLPPCLPVPPVPPSPPPPLPPCPPPGRVGMPDKAQELFDEMRDRGVDWNVFSFTALINAYGRNGQVGAHARGGLRRRKPKGPAGR